RGDGRGRSPPSRASSARPRQWLRRRLRGHSFPLIVVIPPSEASVSRALHALLLLVVLLAPAPLHALSRIASHRGQPAAPSSREPREPRRLPALAAAADPCFQCGAIYSGDATANLTILDPNTGTSTVVGFMGFQMFDIAASSDGRLWGV